MKSKIKWILISLQFLYVQTTLSDASLDKIINYHQQEYEKIALKIWDLAEVGYQAVSYTHLTLPTNREV